ncbi:MAG TPA: hypothetical protein VIS48_05900 [Candidatus Kryptonia bacterium]
MNKHLFILSIAGSIFITSCNKGDNIITPSSKTGVFIVDSIGTNASVKRDSSTNNLRTFVTFSLVYHFENSPGALDNISLFMKNSYGVNVIIDYIGPESMNDSHRFAQQFSFPDSLSGKDSVKVIRGLSGTFWIKNSTNGYDLSGNFSWKDSLYVPIER